MPRSVHLLIDTMRVNEIELDSKICLVWRRERASELAREREREREREYFEGSSFGGRRGRPEKLTRVGERADGELLTQSKKRVKIQTKTSRI